MKILIGQQGEVRILKIEAPVIEGTTKQHNEKTPKGFIISHSESGNHHILTGGDVMERTQNVPDGMRILYALLDKPEQLFQDAAGNPHGHYDLAPGWYEFRISREYNPFAEQARIVAD